MFAQGMYGKLEPDTNYCGRFFRKRGGGEVTLVHFIN
jgi:hypothetical protein